MTDSKTTAMLEQTVIRCARRVTRCTAEFPDDPSICAEDLDGLYDAMAALDRHLDEEFEKRMA